MNLFFSFYKKLYVVCLLIIAVLICFSVGCGSSSSSDNNFNTSGSTPSEGTQGGGDDGDEGGDDSEVF